MTTRGRIMNAAHSYLPRSVSRPIWDNLSRNFARGASGNINVFHNTAGVSWTKAHSGLDFAGDIGDPVYALHDGVVDSIGGSKAFGPHRVRIKFELNIGLDIGVSAGVHTSYSSVETGGFVLGFGINFGVGFNPIYGLDANFQIGILGAEAPFRNKR